MASTEAVARQLAAALNERRSHIYFDIKTASGDCPYDEHLYGCGCDVEAIEAMWDEYHDVDGQLEELCHRWVIAKPRRLDRRPTTPLRPTGPPMQQEDLFA